MLEITFSSTAWKKIGENAFEVTGPLTLHGTTRTATARVELGGIGAGRGGKRLIGFLATFSVKRSEYGMAGSLGPIGDDVLLTVAVEAHETKVVETVMPPASNRLASLPL